MCVCVCAPEWSGDLLGLKTFRSVCGRGGGGGGGEGRETESVYRLAVWPTGKWCGRGLL